MYFYPKMFENLLRNNGFSRKAFTAWAMNRNLLKCSGKRDTYVRKEGKKPMRYIVIKISDEEIEEDLEEEQEQFVPVDVSASLPFS